MDAPWEVVASDRLRHLSPALANDLKAKSKKVFPSDPVCSQATVACVSATDLSGIADGVYDLVVTDPPFGGLLHYSELATSSTSGCSSPCRIATPSISRLSIRPRHWRWSQPRSPPRGSGRLFPASPDLLLAGGAADSQAWWLARVHISP